MKVNEGESNMERLLEWLRSQVAFHHRWRRLMMMTYAFTTVVTVTTAALATIFAASQWNRSAAACAAATTVLLTIEKSLLFREKWKLHLTIFANLTGIQLGVDTGQMDIHEAVERARRVLEQYAAELPIGPRD